jgi:hypothetical protein
MRGIRCLAIGVLAVVAAVGSGCQSSGPKRTVISAEPGLNAAPDTEKAVASNSVDGTPVKDVSFADRHPLFSKPRQYWDSSGDNRVVKAAAATFIGVPVGFYGEVRQIIVGAPPEVRY